MQTKALIERLCRRHETRNPFELAEAMGIIVLYEPLGQIRGYYNRYCRQKFIHINEDLEEHNATFTCCHELGHAVRHPDMNTPFLRNNTLFSIDKLETQANQFAILLMFSDYELQFYLTKPIYDAARNMRVPLSLAEYRMRLVEPKLLADYFK